jgi:2-oxoglutarate ferredoxin oxidoreductase subunit alpha
MAMSESELSIKIGGDAGQGVESSGAGFGKALVRAGLHVFAAQDYRSRIRGGHDFYQIRAAIRPVYAHADPPELLLALTPRPSTSTRTGSCRVQA